MFSTEHQKLSRPIEKRLATPKLKTTALDPYQKVCLKDSDKSLKTKVK